MQAFRVGIPARQLTTQHSSFLSRRAPQLKNVFHSGPALAFRAGEKASAVVTAPPPDAEISKSQGPYVKGTVNDPTPFPTPSRVHGSYHWTFERFLSAALVPLVGATMVTSVSPVVDGVFSAALIAHSYIGFDSSRVDYLHPRKFPVIGPIVLWALRLVTAGALFGLYQFNTRDIGLSELVKRAWKKPDNK